MINKKIIYIFLAIIVLILIGWRILDFISSRRLEIEKQQIEVKNGVKIEQTISEMISKYNAITDWKNIFAKKDFWEEVYTIELQNAFLTTNGRPILFYAPLDDIWKEDNQYYVRFKDFWRDINFELKFSEEQAQKLLEKLKTYGVYAVVAQIEQVYKKEFPDIITKGAKSFDIYFEEVFVATGNCLDFLHFEDAPLDLLMK